MLYVSFVHQIVVLDGGANRRVKDFFLGLGMDGQLHAYLPNHFCFCFIAAIALGEFGKIRKQFFTFLWSSVSNVMASSPCCMAGLSTVFAITLSSKILKVRLGVPTHAALYGCGMSQ